MIKADNKFNIGDIVYVAGLSDKTKKRYKVSCIYIRVTSNGVTYILYDLDGENGSLCEETIGRYFTQDYLFWSYEECINQKKYGVAKQVKNHFKEVLGRLFVLMYMMVLAIPFLLFQFVHWLITGRKESRSYNYMDKIISKLD